jgi:aryl-alcohol dehydrogenase-like predicted oxidoreductase
MMDLFFERGGNFIDTSNVYARGESERIIGARLGPDPARRGRTVVATKFSASATRHDPNSGGASRLAIINACEASLRRLRTDYIDLYLMHWQDPITPIEETMAALGDLVRSGKVRYLGFSDVPAWKATHAQMVAKHSQTAPLVALQIEYSLLERSVEFDFLPMAAEMGLGVTPWSPIGGGALTGKYRSDGSVEGSTARGNSIARRMDGRIYGIVEQLRALSEPLRTTPGQVALAWLLARSGVVSPIVGPRTIAQLNENLDALALNLTPDATADLDELSKPTRPFPHSLMRRVWGTSHGDMTINGQYYEPSPATPRGEYGFDQKEEQ